MTKLLPTVICLLLATTSSVLARDPYPPMINGQKLLEFCNAREQHRRFSCGYYVMGAVDMLVNGEVVRGAMDGPFAVCPPPGKTPEELVSVVRHYNENHKEARDKPGYELVYAAIREAFPCP
jgi:hypothetical protein